MNSLFFKYKFNKPQKKQNIFSNYRFVDLYCHNTIDNIITAIATKDYFQRNGIKVKKVYVNAALPRESEPTEEKI